MYLHLYVCVKLWQMNIYCTFVKWKWTIKSGSAEDVKMHPGQTWHSNVTQATRLHFHTGKCHFVLLTAGRFPPIRGGWNRRWTSAEMPRPARPHTDDPRPCLRHRSSRHVWHHAGPQRGIPVAGQKRQRSHLSCCLSMAQNRFPEGAWPRNAEGADCRRGEGGREEEPALWADNPASPFLNTRGFHPDTNNSKISTIGRLRLAAGSCHYSNRMSHVKSFRETGLFFCATA